MMLVTPTAHLTVERAARGYSILYSLFVKGVIA
jgi:hypothetical protein